MTRPAPVPVNIGETVFTPAEAACLLHCSERTLRALARKLGACSVIGKSMTLSSADIAIIREATRPCHSESTSAEKSGTTAARLPDGDYEALQKRLTKLQPSASPPKRKLSNGKVISMVRGVS